MIWKFTLKLVELQILALPKGSEILSVGVQGEGPTTPGQIQLWAIVPPETKPDWADNAEEKKIAIVGTGQMAPRSRFLGTVMMIDGALVWHVFVEGVK